MRPEAQAGGEQLLVEELEELVLWDRGVNADGLGAIEEARNDLRLYYLWDVSVQVEAATYHAVVEVELHKRILDDQLRHLRGREVQKLHAIVSY